MDTLRAKILNGSSAEVAQIVVNSDESELRKLFAAEDHKVVHKVLNSAAPKVCQKVFSVAPLPAIVNALSTAPDGVAWRFLKHARPNHIRALARGVAELPTEEYLQRLFDSAPSRAMRSELVTGLPIYMRSRWKDYIRASEEEVTYAKSSAVDANASLIEERKRLLDELSAAIGAKEKTLRSYEEEMQIKRAHIESDMASAQARLQSIEQFASQKEASLREKEAEITKRLAELDEAHRKQVQQRIELKVPEYVSAAVKVLDDRELLYRKKATLWGIHGTVVLVIAILATTAISLYGSGLLEVKAEADISWQMLVFVSFKGLVVLGVLGLWAKHAFTVSSAYMHEAIKRSDRAHAINFGKLYLEIYGNSVDRKELLDIFENWNIASESAFAKIAPADFEPKILEKLTEVLKVAGGKPNAG